MKANIIHDPVKITIDTNIFDSTAYNLSKKGYLDILKDKVKRKELKVFLSSIVIDEAKSHLKKRASDIFEKMKASVSELRKTVGNGALDLLGLKDDTSVPKKDVIINGMVDCFDEYIQSLRPEIFDISTIDIKKVLNDYFEFNPPFEDSKKKKNEFPDAFVAEQIRARFPENDSVIIVSNDKLFQQACLKDRHYSCYNNLDELFDDINKQNDRYAEVRSVLSKLESQIITAIQNNIESNGNIKLEGLSYDRKGTPDGYDYLETMLDSIGNVDYKHIIVDDIDEEEATITLSCSADIDMDCYFNDYDNAPWDHEEKTFVFVESVHVLESHRARFGVRLYLNYQEKTFEIDDIVINLGGDTRKDRQIVSRHETWNA